MRYLICLLLLTSGVYANDYDFRKVRWGMTVDQVVAIESKNKDWILETFQKRTVGKVTVAYTGFMLNNRCSLVYMFVNDKLEGAGLCA